MDISRLSVMPVVRQAPAASKPTQQAPPAAQVEARDNLDPRQRGRGSVEPVVQGELLERERSLYQSTRSFVNERNLDQARPAGQGPEPSSQSRAAITQYLNNTRAEPVSELTRGRSVNFFV